MTHNEIYASLTEVFRDVFDDDALTIRPDTTAADVAGWDSKAHVGLIVATELRFGIRFRTAELEKLGNVGELAHIIAQKLASS